MRIVAVDVSSSSTGIAYVDDGALIDYGVWAPPKKAARPSALLDFITSLQEWIAWPIFDAAVMALPSMTRGHHTVRALAHFEAAAMIAFERRGLPVFEIKDGEARNWALGLKITASKEEAQEEVKKRYPDLKIPPMDKGGGDVIDAYVAALALPEAMRRLRR
jgi:Holliday junction resolvasome RuvABC endonuclease subunit